MPDTLTEITAATLGAATMFQSAAIIGALAQQGAIDPFKVADWAETFAKGQAQSLDPQIRDLLETQLMAFAGMIRTMATVPGNAGRG